MEQTHKLAKQSCKNSELLYVVPSTPSSISWKYCSIGFFFGLYCDEKTRTQNGNYHCINYTENLDPQKQNSRHKFCIKVNAYSTRKLKPWKQIMFHVAISKVCCEV